MPHIVGVEVPALGLRLGQTHLYMLHSCLFGDAFDPCDLKSARRCVINHHTEGDAELFANVHRRRGNPISIRYLLDTGRVQSETLVSQQVRRIKEEERRILG